MSEYRYTVVFEPAEEGGYIASVPALGGLTIEEGTLEEARAVAKDAILHYLEALRRDGTAIPREQGPARVESVAVVF